MRAATKMNGRGAIPEPLARSCAREDVSEAAIGRLPERESLQVKFCEKAGDGRESNWTQTASQKTYCFAAKWRNGCCAMREGPPQRVVLRAVFRSESGAIRLFVSYLGDPNGDGLEKRSRKV